MTLSQFHGARATIVGSSLSVDTSARPGTNYGCCGQYGSDGTNGSYGADCGSDGSSGYMPTDAVDEQDFDRRKAKCSAVFADTFHSNESNVQ